MDFEKKLNSIRPNRQLRDQDVKDRLKAGMAHLNSGTKSNVARVGWPNWLPALLTAAVVVLVFWSFPDESANRPLNAEKLLHFSGSQESIPDDLGKFRYAGQLGDIAVFEITDGGKKRQVQVKKGDKLGEYVVVEVFADKAILVGKDKKQAIMKLKGGVEIVNDGKGNPKFPAPAPFTVSGTVKNQYDEPMKNAKVIAKVWEFDGDMKKNPTYKEVGSSEIDKEGKYILKLEQGVGNICVVLEGKEIAYRLGNIYQDVSEYDIKVFDKADIRPYNVSGKVVDQNGDPVKGAKVTVKGMTGAGQVENGKWQEPPIEGEAETDVEGKFSFELKKQIWAVDISYEKLRGYATPDYKCVDQVLKDVVLTFPDRYKPYVISGKVMDQYGDPVDGAVINAYGMQEWKKHKPGEKPEKPLLTSVRSDKDGIYTLKMEKPLYEIEAEYRGKKFAQAHGMQFKNKDDMDLKGNVEDRQKEYTVKGRIIDQNGDPAVGLRVDAIEGFGQGGRMEPVAAATATTNADGLYELKLKVPVNYLIVKLPRDKEKHEYKSMFKDTEGVDMEVLLYDKVKPFEISGKLLDSNGKALPGIKVYAMGNFSKDPQKVNKFGHSKREVAAQAVTDDEGRYVIKCNEAIFALYSGVGTNEEKVICNSWFLKNAIVDAQMTPWGFKTTKVEGKYEWPQMKDWGGQEKDGEKKGWDEEIQGGGEKNKPSIK